MVLNLVMEVHKVGFFEWLGVKFIGVQLDVIERGEDCEVFKKFMDELGLEICCGGFVHSMEEVWELLKVTGFPVIIWFSFILGGLGGGIVYNVEKFEIIVVRGFDLLFIC